jgi:hypothetical protein
MRDLREFDQRALKITESIVSRVMVGQLAVLARLACLAADLS